MKWLEVRIKTTQEACDAVSEMLTSLGAGGVLIEDPNDIRMQLESPGSLDYADEEFLKSLGSDVVVKAYFGSGYEKDALIGQINEKLDFISGFLDTGKGYDGCAYVDDEDWSTAWKKYYKPFHLSERIVVKPSWEEYSPRDNEIVIIMDPGMAFGTGTHETTQMCAALLEKYMKGGDTVIDVGCGTGILSIIAAKLGASGVKAVDIDDTAVKVSLENCRLNMVEDRVEVFGGVLEDLEKKKADIVVANIIADVIVGLANHLPSYLKQGGLFITSGIIRERRQDVVDAYNRAGFVLADEREMGEWVAMVFKWENSL